MMPFYFTKFKSSNLSQMWKKMQKCIDFCTHPF